MKKAFSILIKAALIVIGVLGIVFTIQSAGFMGGKYLPLYFTVQSNITIILISAVFLINELVRKKFVNQFWYILKYIFTVAITITFLVFFTMLAPMMGADYLLSFNNFSLHAIVPILALIDFFVFDRDIDLTYPKSLFGLAMPLYYVIFYFCGVPLGVEYAAGSTAPYFFLDFGSIGWFFEKGTAGTAIWILILLVAMSLLCLLFAKCMKLRQKTKRA